MSDEKKQTEAEEWKELFEMMYEERNYYRDLLTDLLFKNLEGKKDEQTRN